MWDGRIVGMAEWWKWEEGKWCIVAGMGYIGFELLVDAMVVRCNGE